MSRVDCYQFPGRQAGRYSALRTTGGEGAAAAAAAGQENKQRIASFSSENLPPRRGGSIETVDTVETIESVCVEVVEETKM